MYSFTLNQDIDTRDKALAITVAQGGKRLETYRNNNNPFKPSKINIALVSEEGEYIGGGYTEGRDFLTSATVDDRIMTAGRYYFMIDCSWNQSANSD